MNQREVKRKKQRKNTKLNEPKNDMTSIFLSCIALSKAPPLAACEIKIFTRQLYQFQILISTTYFEIAQEIPDS